MMGNLQRVLAATLCLFVLKEVNYPQLSPQTQLAIFAMLALVLCFIGRPLHPRLKDNVPARTLDIGLALASVFCCGYVVLQGEPLLRRFWTAGQSLGNRAGQETTFDVVIGVVGILLVLEATRRAIGWALPILAVIFIVYAMSGPSLPDWLFPHRGYGIDRIVAQSFLHSQGVFGTALRVMFTYVFLFVLFGALLKQTGATKFIIDLARRLFGGSSGGPAKIAVLSSGLMGSLSGSAVANTATTGTFTIPMMRSSGFRAEVAGGVEAAASSGGALVPPVMGAGAYMMLEIIEPAVTYVEIIRAALIPALLYYLSLFLIVHFQARKIGGAVVATEEDRPAPDRFAGLIFAVGFAGLLTLLFLGYTVFRAVSVAGLAVVVISAMSSQTRLTIRRWLEVLREAGRDVVPLVTAAACVGIVIGVVTLTGIGSKLPSTILDLSQGNLLSALVLIMISSIILGMGLPSAVCYLLMATLIGPVLGQLGVVPLAAHLFIFYFGMMSMVTPPVALAAYAAASIAGSPIMKTALAAFRFALVGFTLPFMFVYRPQLLMLNGDGEMASSGAILGAVVVAVLGILPFAAAIAGYLFGPLARWQRGVLLVAAFSLLIPGPDVSIGGAAVPWLNVVGVGLLLVIGVVNRARRHKT